MAVAQRVGGAQTFGHPTLSERHRVRHGVAVRQRAGGRGGQGVTSAVIVAGVHPRRVELVEVRAVEQHVGTPQ